MTRGRTLPALRSSGGLRGAWASIPGVSRVDPERGGGLLLNFCDGAIDGVAANGWGNVCVLPRVSGCGIRGCPFNCGRAASVFGYGGTDMATIEAVFVVRLIEGRPFSRIFRILDGPYAVAAACGARGRGDVVQNLFGDCPLRRRSSCGFVGGGLCGRPLSISRSRIIFSGFSRVGIAQTTQVRPSRATAGFITLSGSISVVAYGSCPCWSSPSTTRQTGVIAAHGGSETRAALLSPVLHRCCGIPNATAEGLGTRTLGAYDAASSRALLGG